MEIDCKGRLYYDIPLDKEEDLTGQRFGLLTVLKRVMVENPHRKHWLCLCECGNLNCVTTGNLIHGKTNSCGCNSGKFAAEKQRIDLIGMKFGRLTVTDMLYIDGIGTMWICSCDCGGHAIVSGANLRNKITQSCGCLHRDMMTAKWSKDLTGQKFGMLTALYPSDKVSGDRQRRMWHCKCDCGNEIDAVTDWLTSGHIISCGCLTTSYGEAKIESILNENKIQFRPQQTFVDLTGVGGGNLKYDFAILNENNNIIRLIEFDGPQHDNPTDYFGGQDAYEILKEHDNRKNIYALDNNIPLIRIPYIERMNIDLNMLLGNKYLINNTK